MIRLISDLHGNSERHIALMEGCTHSVQLGDLGFDYTYLNGTSLNHTFIGGNHDNYDVIEKCPNYLGKYGMYTLNDITFFYVSGAFSVDKQYRIPFVSWWPSEELSYSELNECIAMYGDIKPSLVISHTAPTSIAKMLVGDLYIPNRTSAALQQMYEIHQPAHWYFGHFHFNKGFNAKNLHSGVTTHFQCIKDKEYIDIGEVSNA